MKATLLLLAGVTSEASIKYKDEDELLQNTENADEVYIKGSIAEKNEMEFESYRRIWNI